MSPKLICEDEGERELFVDVDDQAVHVPLLSVTFAYILREVTVDQPVEKSNSVSE
jgi:hypothetical protein